MEAALAQLGVGEAALAAWSEMGEVELRAIYGWPQQLEDVGAFVAPDQCMGDYSEDLCARIFGLP